MRFQLRTDIHFARKRYSVHMAQGVVRSNHPFRRVHPDGAPGPSGRPPPVSAAAAGADGKDRKKRQGSTSLRSASCPSAWARFSPNKPSSAASIALNNSCASVTRGTVT